MNLKHALRPDLDNCVLEDRALMAGYVWVPLPFMQVTTSNQIAVSGFSMGGGPGSSGGSNPGANAYYLRMGINTNVYGLVGQSSVVVPSGFALTLSSVTPAGAGAAGNVGISVGSGANAGGGGSGAPNLVPGYSGSFSSGYGTSLNPSNNYGVSASPVGSIPVQTYGGDNSAPPSPPRA